MLIKELSCSGRGLASVAIVCFMTNRPKLATFWRISVGSGFSEAVTDVRKIVQSFRLYNSASPRSGWLRSQPSLTALRRAAALSSRSASSSRGREICQ